MAANKSKSGDAPEIHVRVKPYPFEAMIEMQGQKKEIEIIYLTTTGFIAHMRSVLVHVGDYHNIHFDIPVLRHAITAQTRVLKTYDKSLPVDSKRAKIERTAEFHFEKLTDYQKRNIVAFLVAIGQTK